MEDNQLLQENIIISLGLSNLPDEEKAKIVEQVLNLLQKRIMLRITELVAAEDDAIIEQLSGDFGRLIMYLKTKVPNFDKILEEEVLAVKKELSESVSGNLP